MKTVTQWAESNTSNAAYLGLIEWQDMAGEWRHFEVMKTPDRLIFGGACNVGFMESGHILREDGETTDETLSEMLADLEVFYNDGPGSVSRIVCNKRM